MPSPVELTPQFAPSYLSARPDAPPGPYQVTPLGGGVSNTVLLVETPSVRFVLKQALARLRVAEEWLADRERILRECSAMRRLRSHLQPGSIPEVLFEDRDNFIFALEAAPPSARDWKSLLLNKRTRFEHAARAAEILAGMFAATYANPTWRAEFGDQHCFDQLRLDPYYRFTATRHPDLAGQFKERIEACRKQGCALVHGDYSPKNFLVSEDAGREMMLIDFEVIHFGDPSFDAAFLLNHLLLKLRHGIAACRDLALHFWRVLSESIHLDWFERSTLLHLGCLHLARVDGKSPAEYLTGEEREVVRRAAREMILEPRESVEEVFR